MLRTLCCLAMALAVGSCRGTAGDRAEEPDRPGEAFSMVMLLYQARGGLVRTPEAATAIAAAVLTDLHGASLLDGRPPLQAEDMDEFWLVTGSANTPDALVTGLGFGSTPDGTTDSAISIRVRKSDAAITYLNVAGPPLTVPEALRDAIRNMPIDQGD